MHRCFLRCRRVYFSPDAYKRYNTIDKLFGIIQEAINRKAEVVSVAYDQVLGYPTVVSIDQDRSAADDEVTFWIEQFEALK